MVLRQKIFLACVIAGNIVAWAIPNNVVELVAREQQVLLSRYSRDHFAINVGILIVSVLGLYIDQARSPKTYKRRWFQVITALLSVALTLVVVDVVVRSFRKSTYVVDPRAYRRPPNSVFREKMVDRPLAEFSYPNATPGYPTIDCTLSTDARGFRNRTALDRADVVVLGDSFVEGSHVSDEHPWPVRLAEFSGLSVYSLGMSGYSPFRYYVSLKEYGLERKPRIVLCSLYEGNDIRSQQGLDEDTGYGLGKAIRVYVKQSPLLQTLDGTINRTFGPIGTGRPCKGLDVMSWLPFRVPDGPTGKCYAFGPKQITQAYMSEQKFEDSGLWDALSSIFKGLKNACDESGAKLVLVYVPTKPHVVLPLALDRLPAEKVYGFARIVDKKLPDQRTFMTNLVPYLGSREAVVRRWCEQQGVGFVELTEPLRQAAASGQQVYFTYDQHWTPIGHEVAARAVAEYLKGNGWGKDKG